MAALENKSEIGFRGTLPFMSTLGLIFLMEIQYKIPYLDNFFPYLSMAGIYFWCISKPNLMPVSVVFILGLLQDILSGGPLGMTALCFIVLRLFVISQGGRLSEREFLFNWLVFVMVSVVFGMVNWAIASLYLKDIQNLWNSLGRSMLTIAIFPAISVLLGLLRQQLVAEK